MKLWGALFGFIRRKFFGTRDDDARQYFRDHRNWTTVGRSTNVDSIAYYSKGSLGGTGTLRVVYDNKRKFGRHTGKRPYDYYEVPLYIYTSMLSTYSKGEFSWDHLRGSLHKMFSYRRVPNNEL